VELLGVFFIFYLLRVFKGDESEEHQAARAIHALVTEQAKANTANLQDGSAQLPAAALPAQLPQATPTMPAAVPQLAPPVATAPTAVAPTGTPIQLPQLITPAGAPASQAASPAPFPAAIPSTLPAFPAGWGGGQPPGWVYATPVTAAVSARAMALLPQLWATGAGTHTTEMEGGVWVTFNAEWSDAAHTRKGVTAYRPKVGT
jgi:hypothetical protein